MLNQLPILVADDDDDDKQLLKYAFEENQVQNPLLFVEDGEHLLKMLEEMAAKKTLPAVIMLDLNMPRMDGREALKRIKNHPELKRIPVVIFSTSSSEIDIRNTYALGAASYIKKPVEYEKILQLIQTFKRYWFDSVLLPSTGRA